MTNTNIKVSKELTERFIKGLETHDLSHTEIMTSKWFYCGGDTGSDLTYYNNNYKKDIKKPLHESHCVCGHFIDSNCYLTDGKQVLILGKDCIKKFKGGLRMCIKCNKYHKCKFKLYSDCKPKPWEEKCKKCSGGHTNKFVDRCNPCRVGICDNCGKNNNPNFDKCFTCLYKLKTATCSKCPTKIEPKFKNCIKCK